MSELIDNRAHRIRILKDIIQELHRGADPDAVRGALRTMVRETSSSEIAAMEQELIAGGMPVEEFKSMCDLHSQVLREVLVEPVQIAHALHILDRHAAGYQLLLHCRDLGGAGLANHGP